MRLCAALVPLWVWVATAQAQPALDPDDEIARKHFARGLAQYDAGAYESALVEFRAAYTAKPAPEFQFNIARCLDRLEQWQAAADAYASYLAGKPSASDAAEVRQRIEVLRARANGASAPPSAKQPATQPPPREPTAPPLTAAPPPTTNVVTAPSAPPAKKPVYKRWWLWTAVGVVVAGAAVGIGVAASAPHDAPAPGGAIPIHFLNTAVSP